MSSKPDSLLKPREMLKTFSLTGLAALLAATVLTAATPAQAQIGTIFSDPPPLRPPGSIPRGQPQPQQIPDDDEEVPELPPQGRVLPSRPMPPPQGRPGNIQGNVMPGPVESQPLAPPTGSTAAPPNQPPAVAVAPPNAPGAAQPGAPGQRQPQQKGGPSGPVPQTPASLQPGDEVVTEPPAQKIVNKKATLDRKSVV